MSRNYSAPLSRRSRNHVIRSRAQNSNIGGRFYVKDEIYGEENGATSQWWPEPSTLTSPNVSTMVSRSEENQAILDADWTDDDDEGSSSTWPQRPGFWSAIKEDNCTIFAKGDSKFPEFNIDGKFDMRLARNFVMFLNEARNRGHKLVLIRINSPGGNVSALNIMLAHIQAAKDDDVVIATVCDGEAMSCGAILLAMGTPGYRYIGRNTKILFHRVSAGCAGSVEEMKTEFAEINYTNTGLFMQVARNVGLEDEKYYLNMVLEAKGNINIHPASAIWLRIADNIGMPTIKRRVEVTYTLENSDTAFNMVEIERMREQARNSALEIYDDQTRGYARPETIHEASNRRGERKNQNIENIESTTSYGGKKSTKEQTSKTEGKRTFI